MIASGYKKLPIDFRYLLSAVAVASFLLSLQEYLSYVIANYGYSFSWFSVAVRNVITFAVLLLFTPAISHALDAVYGRNPGFKQLVKLLIYSLFIAVSHQLITILLYNCVYALYTGQPLRDFTHPWIIKSFLVGIFSSWLYYWFVFGAFLVARYQQKLLKKEKELINARLHALMTQLQPHFLFNTLNSISSLMDFNVPASQQMLNRLAVILRAVLEKEDKQFSSLWEEIQFINNYLAIEKVRFRERLEVYYDIAENTKRHRVPTLILQPLVENAIKHGIAKRLERGRVEISSAVLNGQAQPRLRIRIDDNGADAPSFSEVTPGVGLSNVKGRLEELYPGNYEIRVGPKANVGFRSEIIIPI